ncbi:hypothetical protein GA0070609_6311 [Micromonospora echinaurantiaca]|uniref:Uncharacterized protein n=1 Tax=Micromonospora echinaurantiaca TaxID=47857 RepID=A0A1C5KBS3_9ACTN|nr:hypothetical protein [Micromonospora echinaurantiaca]SCG80217.1 hypothetical protein GA0070609_6311 [Micromonospora echinaurantiaca]
MVPAPVYPPLVPDYAVPALTVAGLVVAVVSMVVFVWFCLGAPGVIRKHGRFPAVLLVVPVLVAVTAGGVAYLADRAAHARHDELGAAWSAQTRQIEERTITAVENAYGVEIVRYWFVPDEGSDRIEVKFPDGRMADCRLTAADGVLSLECPDGR